MRPRELDKDKELEKICNPRLVKLKKKTLSYCFDIIHVPGGWRHGPYTQSRYPVHSPPVRADPEAAVHASINAIML